MLDIQTCEKVERAHQEWLVALDSFKDAIFMHDSEFRILRCNKAYQQYTGLSFDEIIGHKYYEIFPKTDAPSCGCREVIKNSGSKGHEEELYVGDTIFRSLAYSIIDNEGKYLYSMHTLENITTYKSLEKELRESEEKFRSITTSAQDAILMIDDKGNISYWNRAAEKIFGYSAEEVIGHNLHDLIAPKRFLKAHKMGFKDFIESGEGAAIGKTVELAALKKDGTEFPVELSLSAVKRNSVWNAIGILRDISERMQAEKKMHDEQIFSETLIQSVPGIFFLLDQNAGILQWNKKLEVLLGISPKDMPGTNALLFIHEDDREYSTQNLQKAFETGSASVEVRLILTNGVRNYILTGNRVQTKFGVNVLGIGVDITQRKEAEILLQQERDFSNHLVDTAPVIVLILDTEGKIIHINHYMENLTGYSLEEVVGKDWFDTFLLEYDRENLRALFRGAITDIQTQGNINPILIKSGEERLVEWYDKTLLDSDGNTTGLLSVGLDVTTRKQAENLLNRANRALKTLSAGNVALVKATNEDELLHTITKVIVQKGGYALATVVYADDNIEKSMTLKAWSSEDKDYFYDENLSWDSKEEGKLPSIIAIQKTETVICKDIENGTRYSPWKDACKLHGFASNIALPLMDKDKVFGALSIYAYQKDSFDTAEVHLLEELANDLAYGIINLRTSVEHERHSLLLQQSLEQSIQAIAATLESRDPYTAGHQRRVAELATAIAKKMNLPDNQVQGISFASIIHDLGKIHVPSEILSKPGKLNELEYKLIQMHPQTGYDILKDIKFPWPIATIILQHHEKIDGSGYPQGLKGDEILLESRIVALADVVEAMSSHRPYRPSVGIDAALDEIRRGRGSSYEPSVVDACLELFEKEKFTFSSTF